MLHLHRAERADGLVAALGDVLAEPLADPMEPEVVSVPTHGVERWLAQRLSSRLGTAPFRRDGVCANIDFPFPGRLVGGAMAAASGIDRSRDPWLPERAVWPLLDVVDECLPEPWLAALAAHLGGGPGSVSATGRRFGSIRHIADLYDSYAVHRPDMVRAWAAGADASPSDAAWQSELWRRLRDRIGIEIPSPAERLVAACARLRAEPGVAGLPSRLSLFGLTRLPASYLQVLDALAVGRDVHLFLLHPSPVLWDRLTDLPRRPPALRRGDDRTAELVCNPLVASWAHDAREMQLVLMRSLETAADDHRGIDDPASTLLQRIQADIRADRSPPGVPLPGGLDGRSPLDPDDRSLQVHACHGQARQVEVIRDAILHVLSEDPSLEPRDVIVMCPDIETFAPLIHATFGAGDANPEEGDHDQRSDQSTRPADLQVRMADRSLRQTNPVLGVVAELLALATARLTASQVLDLAGREPVRRRFNLDDDDLAQVQEWATATGVRWGIDAEHRAPFKLDWLDANTWRSGLDRVLLGVAMAEEDQRLVGGVLPLDDIGSGDIDLAGRFAELIDRLAHWLRHLADHDARPVDHWARSIAGAADALTATGDRDAWQREQLETLLDDVVAEATADHSVNAPCLTLAEIRSLLGDRLRGRPTRANFRTGHLTICTLVPMRSVPHRVVCLLGLDEGVFPRRTARDGDDLLLHDPHIGDRDARREDRQLLLDAVMAATDRLIITYAGRDERTNAQRSPAVPVGELLDLVDRTVRPDGDQSTGPARHQVLVHHPLQPFDPRNFTAGQLVLGRAWSFDPIALDGARALSGPRSATPPFLDRPLPPATLAPVEVEQMVKFVQHPVKAFLRQRLGVSVADYSEEVSDAVPVELDKLEAWGVGQRLLEARLNGAELDDCIAAEKARGILPPGAFAQPLLDQVLPVVEEVVSEARALVGGDGERGSIDINLQFPDHRTLVGSVPDVSGTLLRTVTFSRVGPKHRLATWVRFLALTAAYPDRPFHAVTVGRARFEAGPGFRVTVSRIGPFERSAEARAKLAEHHLAQLIDLYDLGMREPLPLYCKTTAAHAEAMAEGRDAEAAARSAWESSYRFDKEDRELEHLLVLGGQASLASILAESPRDDEQGEGWAADAPTRFGRYARRLWDGLLSCEELVEL
ncbi:MAG: exodeoxyribonuclease V subunit gamma [Actinomycetota bacterium]|nr:exodeoxyribonuclease V subunit gamma [Actinomycetota bacterium]